MNGKDLFLLVFAGYIVWQLASGRVLDRYWNNVATREDEPAKYWLLIGLQGVAAVGVFLFLPEPESELAPIEIVTFATIAGVSMAGYYFFNSDIDAVLKRRLLRVGVAAAGAGVVAFVWYEDVPLAGLIAAAAMGVFLYFVADRTVSFCAECGKASWSHEWRLPAQCCPKCGTPFGS